MQISIIIPIYNVEPYIERCINSIIAQDFTDYEVILVDDASPDNALQIAEKLLQENDIVFQSIQHPKNQGLSEARNSGIKVAKGKYIMFIDSDDELAHNNVLSCFYTLLEREKVDFVCANYSGIWGKNDIRRGKYIKGIAENKLLKEQQILEALLYTEVSVSAWNKLINKSFLLQNNLFFEKGLKHEDELWAFQMALVAKRCYCLKDYTYNYHKTNPNSITLNMDEESYSDIIYIIKKQLEIQKQQQLLNPENCNAFIFHFKRISSEVIHTKLLKNKELWIYCYTKIGAIYKQNELYAYKKLFRLPAPIAYFIRKERHKNWKNKGNQYYGKLLRKVDGFNGF